MGYIYEAISRPAICRYYGTSRRRSQSPKSVWRGSGSRCCKVSDMSPAGQLKAMDAIQYFVDQGGDLDIQAEGYSVRRMINNVRKLIPALAVFLEEEEEQCTAQSDFINNPPRSLFRAGASDSDILRQFASGLASSGVLDQKQKKIGRNDPCQCGSKRKFKACCGKA